MRRLLLLVCALIVIAGLVIGCQPSADNVQLKKLDDSIHGLEGEFAQYYLMGRQAAVSDVQAETKKLTATWDEMKQNAEGLDGVDLTKATEAHKALVDAVAALPDDAPEGAAMQVAVPKLETFKEAIEELHESGGFAKFD